VASGWIIQTLGSQYSPASCSRSMCTVASPAGKSNRRSRETASGPMTPTRPRRRLCASSGESPVRSWPRAGYAPAQSRNTVTLSKSHRALA
jgi:hypothetical protein